MWLAIRFTSHWVRKEKLVPFWEHHPEHGVYVFNTAFLTAAHKVIVIDARTFYAVDAGFKRNRIAKFGTPVSQECAEKTEEIISAEFLFQSVKDYTDNTFVQWFMRKAGKSFFCFRKKVSRTFLESLGEWTVSISVQ